MKAHPDPFARVLHGILEQFQQECEAVLRSELRQNKGLERFGDSVKPATATGISRPGGIVRRCMNTAKNAREQESGVRLDISRSNDFLNAAISLRQ